MNIHQLLKTYWGYDAFRPLQEDIIDSVLQKKDTLALMPTGGGKSLCFQIPALAMEGICIVISPLIALMQDQVAQLKKMGIPSVAIFSGMHKNQIDIALDNCIYGDIKFLYISPERLQTNLFLGRAKQMKICLLAIDEAHCISQWGYDFRPPYLKIAEFRETITPKTPLIALTATATRLVKEDILDKLMMLDAQVFQQSFSRENLSYSAFKEEDKERRLLKILQNVPGASVVYVRNRRKTQEISEWLHRQGVSSTFYHAGLLPKERIERQEKWIRNSFRVMVATNAFGMGIDKPDVRSVIHLDLPDSLEAYYQEAGRAGRDREKAYAVALFNQSDLEGLEKNVLKSYPDFELIKMVYEALGNYFQLAVGSESSNSFDFDLVDFQRKFNLPPNDTFFALKMLENEGFAQLSDAFYSPSRLMFAVDNRQLYDFQLRNPRFDSFIKLILRVYGGELFTNYLTISEQTIAKNFSAPLIEVETMLLQMEKLNIVVYEKQKDRPQLTFLTQRFDAKVLPLNFQEISQRKERDVEKARAVVYYMQHNMRCRTQILLEYFDEITDNECGICDNCLAKKRQENQQNYQQQETEADQNKILQLLENGAMSLELLIKIMQPSSQSYFIEVIRKMLAIDLIKYDREGNIVKNG